jgi:hypothetical protein
MKLLRYDNFIESELNEGIIRKFYDKAKIKYLCKKYDIKNYTINEDGSIDVDGNVDLRRKGLKELPIKFRKVSDDFYCFDNRLTSLSGAPREVGGGFHCFDNRLTSLSGAPREVGLHFSCSRNQLLSLEGSPEKVGGDFFCRYNLLTSLSGISKYISGGIYCENNQLRDVMGVKDGWSGKFYVEGNPVFEIFKLFPEERWDEVVEFLNEYNVIRDGKLVILQGLEQIFLEMGLEVPGIEEIGYQIQY